MIALNQQYVETDVDRSWQDQFLDMLPSLNAYTRYAFRHLPLDSREEAIQEALALALAMLVRLYQQGRGSLAYATALARYAVAQVCSGRRAATSSNSSDVLSVAAQRKHHFHVERLDVKCPEDNQWRDAVIEDHRTPVADQAAFRIDFPAWIAQCSVRDRRIALCLARGDRTSEVAQEFELTPGRISQLRRRLAASWESFHEGGAVNGPLLRRRCAAESLARSCSGTDL